MIEIEVKARAEHRMVKEILEGMGVRFVGVEKHCDTYYNAPHRDFARTDEALRIRSVDGRSVMTYKSRKKDILAKVRDEFETDVDGMSARSILLALGFRESGVVRKTREVFRFEDLTICLDNVKGIGEFIEVEITAESDVEAHQKRIFEFLEMFGIGEEDSIRTSYLEMVLGESADKQDFVR